MRKIGIVIDDDGNIQIETDGFRGKSCLTETDKLIANLKALGIETDTLEIKAKPEMNQIEATNTAEHRLRR